MNKMGFGFGNKPIGKSCRNIGILLEKMDDVSQPFDLQRAWEKDMEKTYSVDEVEDQPHCHAKLFEIQIAIIINIGNVPDTLQLVISQLTVLENGSSGSSGQILVVACKR
jgi:hypothetical protein